MPEFNVRSDSVNVEQIMEQIRARIHEKRGVDYTEQQIRELAAVKLEKFLDPKGVRSDLLEQFRKAQPAYEPPVLPNYSFETETLYETHRGPLRFIRRLLNPILKLFFNPNPVAAALHIQARLNTMYSEREAQREAARRAIDQLNYELLHNLVIEVTRSGIEVKNLKMRIESLTSRLEFNERRARALEGVVVYKPSAEDVVERGPSAPVAAPEAEGQATQPPGEGPGQRSRRRRRRRGRRSGAPAASIMAGGAPHQASGPEGAENFVARDDLEQVSGAPVHPIEAHGNAPMPPAEPPPSPDSAPQLRPSAPPPAPTDSGDPTAQ